MWLDAAKWTEDCILWRIACECGEKFVVPAPQVDMNRIYCPQCNSDDDGTEIAKGKYRIV